MNREPRMRTRLLHPMALLWTWIGVTLATAAPSPGQGEAVDDLGGRVLSIFEPHCAECHGPDLARPKGRFGEVLDLAAMAENAGLVVPGDPQNSELYLLLMDEDPEYKMPPADSEGGPLGDGQIEAVRAWIEAGCPPASGGASADTDRDVGDDSTTPGGQGGEAPAGPQGGAGDPTGPGAGGSPIKGASGLGARSTSAADPIPMRTGIGRFHPIVLHFPIALVITATLLALLAWVSRGPGIRAARNTCLVVGALGGIATSVSGWFFAPLSGYASAGAFDPDSSIFLHRWAGIAGTVLSLFAAFAFTRAARGDRSPGVFAHLLLFGAAAAIGWAGHEGGLLLHGFDPMAWPRAWVDSW